MLPLVNGVDPNEIHRKFIRLLKDLHVQNHYHLGLKGTITVPNKKRPLDPPNSTDRKQIEDTAQRQTHDTLDAKRQMTHSGRTKSPKSRVWSLGVQCPGLETELRSSRSPD